MAEKYIENDKMYELICNDYRLLQIISRFDLPLGVKDKTVEEVCEEQNVDCNTFLAVINYTKFGSKVPFDAKKISIKTLTNYLRKAHSYYLDFLLPTIRRKLITAINCSTNNDIAFLIIKFYDEYVSEIHKHMEKENEEIFPYIDDLLLGKEINPISFNMTSLHQTPVEMKLTELKNIIIKYYYAPKNNNLLNSVLYDIFLCEEDLINHANLEEDIFIPTVLHLEEISKEKRENNNYEEYDDSELLTEREKEVMILIIKGLTNKEIADKLFISINTVTTHRRNITRKLSIHSPSGLTIYAIVNNLVDIKEIQQVYQNNI